MKHAATSKSQLSLQRHTSVCFGLGEAAVCTCAALFMWFVTQRLYGP